MTSGAQQSAISVNEFGMIIGWLEEFNIAKQEWLAAINALDAKSPLSDGGNVHSAQRQLLYFAYSRRTSHRMGRRYWSQRFAALLDEDDAKRLIVVDTVVDH